MVSVIEPSGLIVLREIQDYAFEPVRIEVARALQVKPSHIRGYLRKNVGDFVQRGEWIATRGSFLRVAAPRSGVLKHVDTRAGVVTLHYDLEPVVVRGFVSGVVSRVHPEFGATIVTRAAIVPGRVGFGGERYGELCLREVADGHACSDVGDARGKIIGSFEPVDLEYLRACADSGIAGMVAPSVENRDWVLFSGAEIGVGSTGDEAIPFTLVLTEGFGRHPMSPACHDVLAAANGRMVSLSGRTQIRAGVVRPMVVIGEQAS
jgi:hypothetical protein